MAKLWKVLKIIIFSVGALTLALIAWGLIVTFVPPLFKSKPHQENAAPAEEVIYEKKDGGYKLVVKRKEKQDGPDDYLLSVSREGASLMKNFRLPTEKYELAYINFQDASFIPLRSGGLGLILYSTYADEEGTADSHIWFLRAGDTTAVREMLSLSEVHHGASAGDLTIIGNKRIFLPHQGGFDGEQYVVPVSVRVDDTITITPILSREGADLVQTLFRQEVKAREDKMMKENAEELSVGYRKAGKELNEALNERKVVF